MVTVVLILALCPSGCGDGGKDLFSTAQFEEQQNNQAHAKELYQEIIAKYPQSEYARKADERLRVLEAK
jgi:outer membrane protein assembly factor BamD (BamD/ComL family)